MTSNVFEIASRSKFRFPSPKGQLTTEQLWDLPLTHASPEVATLDQVARAVNTQLKALGEESFVATRRSDQEDRLAQSLEIVKHIIAAKLADQQALKDAASKLQEKARLKEVLAEKDDEQLKKLSRAELLKRLEDLG